MAIAIEIYHVSGAIALCERYDYASLSLLIDQTALLRRTPEEIEKAETEEWIEENKDAVFVLVDEDGNEQFISMEDIL
jgi:hypothetical protein